LTIIWYGTEDDEDKAECTVKDCNIVKSSKIMRPSKLTEFNNGFKKLSSEAVDFSSNPGANKPIKKAVLMFNEIDGNKCFARIVTVIYTPSS
jgi:hypothetical protein